MVGSGLRLSGYPENPRLTSSSVIEIGIGDLDNSTIHLGTEHITLLSVLDICTVTSMEPLLFL